MIMIVKFGRQLGKKYHYRNLGSDIPVIVAACTHWTRGSQSSTLPGPQSGSIAKTGSSMRRGESNLANISVTPVRHEADGTAPPS